MTLRLAGSLIHHWPRFDGQAALAGVDLLHELLFDRLLNAFYYWLTSEADEDMIKKFDQKLYRPIPGIAQPDPDKLGPWSPQAETQSFKGLSASLTGKTDGTATARGGQSLPAAPGNTAPTAAGSTMATKS